MARSQANWITNKPRQQAQGKRSRGIEKRSQRSVRKSARPKNIQQQIEIEDKTTRPKPPFPSPSTSNTPGKEIPQNSPVLSKAVTPPKWARKFSPNLKPEEVEQPCSQNGRESTDNLDRKRKRSLEAENLIPQIQGEPIEKRARISLSDNAIGSKEEANDINIENNPPIEYWTKTGNWPKKIFEPDPNMSQQLTKKRSSSAMSYNQGVKEGIYPIAHSSKYEKQILEPAGIILDLQIGEAAIGHDARELCQTLLKAIYEIPKNSLFEGDLFWKVINGVRNEGEGRVVRDLQSDVVPSAEILFFRGLSKVNYLKETVKIPWNNVVPLAGPISCPDFTVGLLPSAFTEPEIDKLHNRYNTSNTPSRFTGNLYFPFFTCEAKCGANGLNESDRQNARSAATAINAILQLYQQKERTRREPETASEMNQLHREILFFSISHDHTFVKIFGHYPLIQKNKTCFYRHLIESFDLTARDGGNRWTAYNFVRKLYDHFAPIHLKRIRDAISYLPEPAFESSMSIDIAEGESEFPDSQKTASAPASQNNEAFKKPSLPSKKQRRNKDTETALLQRELESAEQTPSGTTSEQNKDIEIAVLQRELELVKQTGKWQQEIDRKDEQINQLMALLKQQTPSDVSSGKWQQENAMLQQELERQRQREEESKQQLTQEREESKQQLTQEREESKQQLTQEREESKQRHAELMCLLNEQKKLIDTLSKG